MLLPDSESIKYYTYNSLLFKRLQTVFTQTSVLVNLHLNAYSKSSREGQIPYRGSTLTLKQLLTIHPVSYKDRPKQILCKLK